MIDHPEPIAPGAASQLAHLVLGGLAALAVVLVLALARRILRWRAGRGPTPAMGTPAATGDTPPAPPPAATAGTEETAGPGDAGAGPAALRAGGTRLLGAVLVLVLAMPTAAAVRQLWPHPDLEWRLLVVWLLAWLPPVAAWLALARRGRHPGADR
jgi:hypothetical protein